MLFIFILQDSVLLTKWRNISWAIVCKVKFKVVGFIKCNFGLVPNFFSCGTNWYLLSIMGKNGMPIGNSFFETSLSN